MPEMSRQQTAPRREWGPRQVMVLIVGALVAVVFPIFLVSALSPTLSGDLGVDEATIGVAMAVYMLAGAAALSGLVILISRRRMTGPVFPATTANDKFMYLVLAVVILLGCLNTIQSSGMIAVAGTEHYDYRAGVSVWFRSIFWFQPQPELMVGAPWSFQAHSLTAFFLFAIWPFTRLVHVFSAPLGYITRPYIVYRSRDERPVAAVGTRAPKRGWEQNR